ncbi:uncharacterized protein [Nicotiana tomentosiformis]|uniref:uncharacterized protein n=1 Tax=Nicotiana tomentosiformis TaxID=4098 RepID=UPI00388CB58C
MGLGVCYTCGYLGHVMRDYPTRGDENIAQPAGSVAGSSSSVHPHGQGSQAPMSRGRGRGGSSRSSGPQNHIYALAGRDDHESLPDVVTVVAKRVYRGCIISVHSRSTVANLIELDMVEFDVIMGMDKLASCHANVDCRSKIVRFQFSGEPVLEWKGNTASPRGRFISYLKARKMTRKGCIYHLVRVQDVEVESPTIQSIHVINEFPNVFPDELPCLLPER